MVFTCARYNISGEESEHSVLRISLEEKKLSQNSFTLCERSRRGNIMKKNYVFDACDVSVVKHYAGIGFRGGCRGGSSGRFRTDFK